MVSTETPHVGQPLGLIVEYEVRDRPRHRGYQSAVGTGRQIVLQLRLEDPH
jgi:hypothetical protein